MFEWYLLRIMVFLVTDRRKILKSEEKEKRRIRVKSNNHNINLWF